MNKATVALLVIVAAGVAVWGGFSIHHATRCSGLEEDYLNSASDLRGSAALKSLGGDEITKAAGQLEEMGLRRMKLTLEQIYSECGERAGQTAARKASDLMLGN